MSLIENIKAIHDGQIFNENTTDAILFENSVIKDNIYCGLDNAKLNYFYTRHDKEISVRKPTTKLSSCNAYELVYNKILVCQFVNYKLEGVLYELLNCFDENYTITKVEVRKDFILKSELGELKPMPQHELIMIYFDEYKILDNCSPIECK